MTDHNTIEGTYRGLSRKDWETRARIALLLDNPGDARMHYYHKAKCGLNAESDRQTKSTKNSDT